jgi:uncharacterized damage-inducible protein DinB
MNLKEFISRNVRYNHWANDKMNSWLSSLDSSLLSARVRSSFPSIELTLEHINDSQDFWYAVITESELANRNLMGENEPVEPVLSRLLRGSQKMIDTYTEYTEAELVQKVASPVMIQRRCDFIMHTINHNSYHRGQIVTISRILGVTNDIPETDYETFLWSVCRESEQEIEYPG